MGNDAYSEVLDLALRRGFFWPAYEIYGGVGGFYALGDLGTRLRDRIVWLWRQTFVRRHGFLTVDTPSIGPYPVFKASGHVDNFKDPMAECRKCGRKFRADHLLREAGVNVSEGAPVEEMERLLNEREVKCPECGASSWSVRLFLNMFETRIGPYSESVGFLRPETAQGIFVEFRRIFEASRGKLPIGIAQVGRGFRNEISPRQAMIRLREFNMMELELFIEPGEPCDYLDGVIGDRLRIITEEVAEEGREDVLEVTVGESLERGIVKNGWIAYFMAISARFLEALGVPRDAQRFHAKPPKERAHYSEQTFDHEALIPGMGWTEVAGLAYRTDYDLRSHSAYSGKDLTVPIQLKEPEYRKVVKWRVRSVEELRRAAGEDWQRILALVDEHRNDDGLPAALKELGFDVEDLPIERAEAVEKVSVRRIYPHVVEPSYGVERLMLAALVWAYRTKGDRTVLSLPPYIAPIQVAVFPLVAKDGLPERARMVAAELSREFEVAYDEAGSIGRRYARVDEVGVPYAVTIDHQTLEDGSITLRYRDTWDQVRVNQGELRDKLRSLLAPPDGSDRISVDVHG